MEKIFVGDCKLWNLWRFFPRKFPAIRCQWMKILAIANFISGSLSVCVCKEELKSKLSVSLKSGRKNHIQYEMVPFYHKYDHVPWLVSGYFSFSSLLAIASSLTTLSRKASMRVHHVLGFEFFSFGLYTPLNQWLNKSLKLSPWSFPFIVSNVPSSTPIQLPMFLHLALASQRACCTSFRSAIFKLSNKAVTLVVYQVRPFLALVLRAGGRV